MAMIGPISRVSNLLSPSIVRFERAADEVVRSANQESPKAGATDMVGATTDMMSAKFGFSAALVAARASNEMLAEAIEIGGYTQSR
jgi:hypothetical protein